MKGAYGSRRLTGFENSSRDLRADGRRKQGNSGSCFSRSACSDGAMAENHRDGRRRPKRRPIAKIERSGHDARDERTPNDSDSTFSGDDETPRAKIEHLRELVRSNALKETDLRNRMESALAQFVSTEVDLALTFCEMAHSSRDSNTAQRRIDRAVEAHGSAVHYLQQLDVPEEVKRGINEKLAKLKESLDKVHREKVDNRSSRRTRPGVSRC